MTPFLRMRRCCAGLLLCAAVFAGVTGARAGDAEDEQAAAASTPEPVKHGELVFHGNYCGVGNRAGTAPIDALDEACMHHDACTPTGGIQSCACNARLAKEATAVAADPRQPPELQSLATLTATAATAGLVVCVPGPLVAQKPATNMAPTALVPSASTASSEVAPPVQLAPRAQSATAARAAATSEPPPVQRAAPARSAPPAQLIPPEQPAAPSEVDQPVQSAAPDPSAAPAGSAAASEPAPPVQLAPPAPPAAPAQTVPVPLVAPPRSVPSTASLP